MSSAESAYDALRLDQQVCFPLYAASRKVVSLYTPFLKPLGITYTQYLILLVLWEHDNIPVGELGEKLYLDTGTLTPVLKRMEEEGHLTRTRGAEDERVVMISLTAQGHALREKVQDLPQKISCRVSLSPDDAQTLYRLLYQVLLHF